MMFVEPLKDIIEDKATMTQAAPGSNEKIVHSYHRLAARKVIPDSNSNKRLSNHTNHKYIFNHQDAVR